jgi:hypothetical protein
LLSWSRTMMLSSTAEARNRTHRIRRTAVIGWQRKGGG